MKIIVMVEGSTEMAFKAVLLEFLHNRLSGRMPRLDFRKSDGGVPVKDALKRTVQAYLNGDRGADHVIWLTDVYVDSRNIGKGLWTTAAEAKAQARRWVGEDPRFHPHVALHDFEAWLIPYWDRIKQVTGVNRNTPSKHPESINHGKPPSYHIKALYELRKPKASYVKRRDAVAILRGQDLMIAINACPELKSFVNTILQLSGGEEIA